MKYAEFIFYDESFIYSVVIQAQFRLNMCENIYYVKPSLYKIRFDKIIVYDVTSWQALNLGHDAYF